jgi:hypothetical protein
MVWVSFTLTLEHLPEYDLCECPADAPPNHFSVLKRMYVFMYCYCYGVVSHNASQALRLLLIFCASPPFLIHPPELSGSNQQRHLERSREKLGEKWPWILPTMYSVSYPAGFFLACHEIFRDEAAGFTCPLKEVALRIFAALKIHRLRPGLNPRTLGLIASMITTRPPRPTRSSCRVSVIGRF